MIPSIATVMAAHSPPSIRMRATVTGTSVLSTSMPARTTKPTAPTNRPVAATAKAPHRRIIAGAPSVVMTPTAAPGRSWMAARVGDRPSTNCRYWVTKNAWPAKPKHVSRFPVMATRNRGTANRLTSIIGTGSRRWRRTNAQPARSPTAREGGTTGVKPSSAISFMPKTSGSTAAIDRAELGTSKGAGVGSRDSGIRAGRRGGGRRSPAR